MTSLRAVLIALFLTAALAMTTPDAATAQTQPRFGVGLQMMGDTAAENVGPGLRFRVSAPVNRDLSFAFGLGFTGYVFEGQDDASYVFDPQASVIVTLPAIGGEGTYFLGGAGAYLPTRSAPGVDSAPTFHFGVGKVWLLQESSLFFEFDPALIIAKEQAEVLLPFRVGVIF